MQLVKVQSRGLDFTIRNIYSEKGREGSSERTFERAILPLTINVPTFTSWRLQPSSPLVGSAHRKNIPMADRFIDWVQNQRLELLNDPGKGTYFRSNMSRESVLDLTFATQDLASRCQIQMLKVR